MDNNALIVVILEVAVALFLLYAVYYVYTRVKKPVATPPSKPTSQIPAVAPTKPEPAPPVPEPKPQIPAVVPLKPEPAPPVPEIKPPAAIAEGSKLEPVREEPEPNVVVVVQKTESSKAPNEPKPKRTKAPPRKERGFPVIEIEGIGEKYSEKLHGVGINYTAELLKACAILVGRREFAEKTGISQDLILEWVNLSDLFRIKGIGKEYSDLLEEVGVDTVIELSHRNAENLHIKILEVNEAKKLVRRPPSLTSIESWIAEAKKLPRVIEY